MNADGRDSSGKFAQGNPGGPGRPPRQAEESYLAAMRRAVTPDDWEQVCRKSVEDAKAGDAKARQWIADYLVGRPLPRRDTTQWMTTEEVLAFGERLGDAIGELVPDREVRLKILERAGITVL